MNKMQLRRVEHIGIVVSDMDRSVEWYTKVLGLTLRQRIRLNESTELAFVRTDDAEIELVHRAGPFTTPREGVVNHLAFGVDDISAALAHLRDHGVELINQEPVPVEPLGARVAFFRGPDGEMLELFQRLA